MYSFDELDFIYNKEENKYLRYCMVQGQINLNFIQNNASASLSAGLHFANEVPAINLNAGFNTI